MSFRAAACPGAGVARAHDAGTYCYVLMSVGPLRFDCAGQKIRIRGERERCGPPRLPLVAARPSLERFTRHRLPKTPRRRRHMPFAPGSSGSSPPRRPSKPHAGGRGSAPAATVALLYNILGSWKRRIPGSIPRRPRRAPRHRRAPRRAARPSSPTCSRRRAPRRPGPPSACTSGRRARRCRPSSPSRRRSRP